MAIPHLTIAGFTARPVIVPLVRPVRTAVINEDKFVFKTFVAARQGRDPGVGLREDILLVETRNDCGALTYPKHAAMIRDGR